MDVNRATVATHAEATSALAALNEKLVEAGGTEVSAYNTIVHVIPVEHGRTEIVYQMYYPSVSYIPTGATGTDTITAWILTENGVIYEVKEKVGVYEPASGTAVAPDAPSVAVSGSAELTVSLVGGTEEIESVAWSSADTSKATVENKNQAKCTVNGVAAGTVTLNVTVTTVQGNTYTTSVTVTVG